MKRFLTVLVTLLLAASGALVASPVEARGPYCGIRWGSLDKSAEGTTAGSVLGVRTGRHTCYDRLVIDVAGDVSGYTVTYREGADRGIFDGSSSSGPALRGDVGLAIDVNLDLAAVGMAPRYLTSNYSDELTDVSHYRTFRQVAGGASAGARVFFGIGVRARLPFRVFTLDGPDDGSRLVIDVAHRW